MSTPDRLWRLRRPAPPSKILRGFSGMSPVLAQVLYNRGHNEPDAANRLLYIKDTLYNPLQRETELKGVRLAAKRLLAAIDGREKIVVYGDFDADGVTSTVLMVEILRRLGAVVEPYIPHRIDEGYGLNSEALEKLAAGGAKVVVTVDCGIRSVQEVEDGKDAGLVMIVTDHHSIGPEIPQAFAVVNPKQESCPYPEDMLAGVGVAYKLASALLQLRYKDHKPTQERQRLIRDALENVQDLVAIGTVADLAPLDRPENRALVRMGLDALNRAERPGIRALLEVSGVKPGSVTAMTIGFALGPRINAAGRLDSAMLAYELLAEENYDKALEKAQALQELNIRRQDLTREAQESIRSQLEIEDNAPLIFAQGKFQPGIVGLVAGRLAEEYYRPAVVMEMGETESRASCRSIPQFDITAALDMCADLLVRHGGHAQAAGLTISNENIPRLKQHLEAAATAAFEDEPPQRILEYDAEVDLRDLSEALWEELQQLEPTGHSNEKPVLVSRKVRVLDKRTVGADGQHLKLKIGRPGHQPLDAIGFRLGEHARDLPEIVDIAYQLDMNEWNGSRSLQLMVQDIKPAGAG
jgi:single-stranded-DNA-specific exonuclease